MPDPEKSSEKKKKIVPKIRGKLKEIIGAPLKKSSITLDQLSSAGVDAMDQVEPATEPEEKPKSKDLSKELPQMGEVDSLAMEKILVNLERMNQKIEFIKELKIRTDERIDKLSGELGELRAMFLEREKDIKDSLVESEKIQATMKDLEPDKIYLKFEKLQKNNMERDAELEKNAAHVEDIRKKSEKLQKLLDKIGNFENIVKIHSLVEQKLGKIKEREKNIEILSSKTENAYFEVEKRINSIKDYLTNIERLEEVTKDLLKEIDLVKIKMESTVNEENFNRTFDEFQKSIKEETEEKIKQKTSSNNKELALTREWISNQLDKISSKVALTDQEREQLEKKKEKIAWFLKEIESQYKSQLINKKTFEDVREKNLEEIEAINATLRGEKIFTPYQEFIKGKGLEPAEEERIETKIPEKEVQKPEEETKTEERSEEEKPKEKKTPQGSKFLEIWEKLEEDPKYNDLSKRERQVLSVLFSSEATDKENSIATKELAKAIYRDDYDHDKLSYISRLTKNLEKEGYVIKTSKGRESLISLNMSKIKSEELKGKETDEDASKKKEDEPPENKTEGEKKEDELTTEQVNEIKEEKDKKTEGTKPKEIEKSEETKKESEPQKLKTEEKKPEEKGNETEDKTSQQSKETQPEKSIPQTTVQELPEETPESPKKEKPVPT